MPIIDLQCHYGTTPETRAVAAPTLEQARAYADQYGIEALCFTSAEAATDLVGGHARLDEVLKTDSRFRGWLNLSIHQPQTSLELASKHFRSGRFIGARFEQEGDDSLLMAGGHEVLNGLRRHGKAILVTASTQTNLVSLVEAAREFHTLRFFVNPQNEALTVDALEAIKEVLNIALVPVAAFTERDILARAVANLGERGERRVLWASDWGRFHPATALGAIRDAALSTPHRDRLLYRNAREYMT